MGFGQNINQLIYKAKAINFTSERKVVCRETRHFSFVKV